MLVRGIRCCLLDKGCFSIEILRFYYLRSLVCMLYMIDIIVFYMYISLDMFTGMFILNTKFC